MAKPIIGRAGGKSRILKPILARIPPHTTYVEPFVGGGSVFFAKSPTPKEVINDKDAALYTIYKGVQDTPLCCHFTPSREHWISLKERSNRGEALAPCEEMELIRYSFSLKGKPAGYAPKSSNTQRGAMTKCYDAQHQRLQQTTVLNQDALDVIKAYDGKDTFMYIDPPYAGMCYYGNMRLGNPLCAITPDQLANVLRTVQGKFLLSYNDHPTVRDAFKGFKMEPITLPYSVMRRDKGEPMHRTSELLISNF